MTEKSDWKRQPKWSLREKLCVPSGKPKSFKNLKKKKKATIYEEKC